MHVFSEQYRVHFIPLGKSCGHLQNIFFLLKISLHIAHPEGLVHIPAGIPKSKSLSIYRKSEGRWLFHTQLHIPYSRQISDREREAHIHPARPLQAKQLLLQQNHRLRLLPCPTIKPIGANVECQPVRRLILYLKRPGKFQYFLLKDIHFLLHRGRTEQQIALRRRKGQRPYCIVPLTIRRQRAICIPQANRAQRILSMQPQGMGPLILQCSVDNKIKPIAIGQPAAGQLYRFRCLSVLLHPQQI